VTAIRDSERTAVLNADLLRRALEGGDAASVQLIRRACDGDEAACAQIVQTYQETVFRLAYLLLGDADDAQDATQETFIRALSNLHQFDSTRPLRPWLLQITRHLASNRRRSLGRYLTALRRSLLQEPSSTPTIEDLVSERAAAQALYTAVHELSEADQEVIYLRYFLELSVAETAATLDIEEGTVKSRLSRALSRLRGVVISDYPLLYEGRLP
jgi:RNA polymerase sigma-70 factor (ECF subfamily)